MCKVSIACCACKANTHMNQVLPGLTCQGDALSQNRPVLQTAEISALLQTLALQEPDQQCFLEPDETWYPDLQHLENVLSYVEDLRDEYLEALPLLGITEDVSVIEAYHEEGMDFARTRLWAPVRPSWRVTVASSTTFRKWPSFQALYQEWRSLLVIPLLQMAYALLMLLPVLGASKAQS